jgi:hypothetical protein
MPPTAKPVPKLRNADLYTVYRADGSAVSSLNMSNERKSIFETAKRRFEGSLHSSARELSEDSAMLDLAIRTIESVQVHLHKLVQSCPRTRLDQHEVQRVRALQSLAALTRDGLNLSVMVEPESMVTAHNIGYLYSETDVSRTGWPETSILPPESIDTEFKQLLDQHAASAWLIESGKASSSHHTKPDRTTYIRSGPLIYRRDEKGKRDMFT